MRFDIASISVPVRAFHGTEDPVGLIELAVRNAGGDVVLYEGEGHYLDPCHAIDTIRFCTPH